VGPFGLGCLPSDHGNSSLYPSTVGGSVRVAITIIMCVTESLEVTSAYKDPPVQ
jgi:hypothetical protein